MSDIPDWSQPAPAPVAYQSQAAGSIPLSARGLQLIRKIRPWTLFLAIVGFLFTLMSLGVGFLGILVTLLKIGAIPVGPNDPPLIIVFIGYFIAGICFLIPSIMLMRLSLAIGRLLAFGTPENLEEVIAMHHRFWRLMGIMAIASIILVFTTFFAAIAIALAHR